MEVVALCEERVPVVWSLGWAECTGVVLEVKGRSHDLFELQRFQGFSAHLDGGCTTWTSLHICTEYPGVRRAA